MENNGRNTEFSAAAAKNFRATVRLFGELPTSKTEKCGGYVFVSTGVAIPDQNYAFRDTEEDAEFTLSPKEQLRTGEIVRRSADFFREEEIPFTWWISPGVEVEPLRSALETHGMPERCSPPAMARSLAADADVSPLPSAYALHRVRAPREAHVWASCSLEGFGSGPEHEESFSAFSAALVTPPYEKNFRLMTLLAEDLPAATALLSLTEETGGIYYFSTLPAFRKRGLGMLLLRETLREARRAGCSAVTLQASPMGYPLYKRAGFVECGRFTVHSADPDAC